MASQTHKAGYTSLQTGKTRPSEEGDRDGKAWDDDRKRREIHALADGLQALKTV